jgi:phenylalanine-4-hydroxylase
MPELYRVALHFLFSLVDELERWMRAGKLNNVAPGEPEVNERDLKSFLQRG